MPGPQQIEKEPAVSDGARDDELVARTVAGDASAFDEIVLAYQDRIFNTLFRILSDRNEAEETAQETFLKAFRALAGFRRGARFSTWLYRIAVNAASDRIRRNRHMREGEKFSLDAPVSDGGADAKSFVRSREAAPDEEVAARETHARVEAAVAALDEEFRTVVVLKDVDGMNYEEIASVLGVSLGTVKSRLFRARERLRDELRNLL